MPEVGVRRRRAEGVVVEGRHDLLDAGLVGQGLGELRAELGLGEDGRDAGRLDLLDQRGQVGGRRLLADVAQDDADELEPEVAGEVRERVVERDELPIRRRDRRDLGLQLGVEGVELRAVVGRVRLERRAIRGRRRRQGGRRSSAGSRSSRSSDQARSAGSARRRRRSSVDRRREPAVWRSCSPSSRAGDRGSRRARHRSRRSDRRPRGGGRRLVAARSPPVRRRRDDRRSRPSAIHRRCGRCRRRRWSS